MFHKIATPVINAFKYAQPTDERLLNDKLPPIVLILWNIGVVPFLVPTLLQIRSRSFRDFLRCQALVGITGAYPGQLGPASGTISDRSENPATRHMLFALFGPSIAY